MRCVHHPEREAALRCNYCGKSICSDCQVQAKGENYCRECANAKASGTIGIEHSPFLAGLFSFIVPGLGQVYNGHYAKGMAVFFTCWLIIPWIIGIVDASRSAARIRDGELPRRFKTGRLAASLIAMLCGFFVGAIILVGGLIAVSSFEHDAESPQEEHARTIVNLMSVAAENYARNHAGRFPASESELIDEYYITEGFDGVTRKGYIYSVAFSPDGYRIAAEPVSCGMLTGKIYSATQGQGLHESLCGEEPSGGLDE